MVNSNIMILVKGLIIVEMQADKLRWWSIYHEPEHEFVGKLQLYIVYSTSSDDNSHLKVSCLLVTSRIFFCF